MSEPDSTRHDKEYPDDYPPVEFAIEDSLQHCEYGGLCSVHISMAGKELLRYEAPDMQVANEYIENLEHYQPRLNSRKEWELVIFTDSGFQTLELNAKREPQCVMSHCRTGVDAPDTNTIYERVLKARTLAARYLRWHERRYENITTKNMHKLECALQILNAVLSTDDEQNLEVFMRSFCPDYHVEKGVKKFSKVSSGKKGT